MWANSKQQAILRNLENAAETSHIRAATPRSSVF
jgi:hypothetical protein